MHLRRLQLLPVERSAAADQPRHRRRRAVAVRDVGDAGAEAQADGHVVARGAGSGVLGRLEIFC